MLSSLRVDLGMGCIRRQKGEVPLVAVVHQTSAAHAVNPTVPGPTAAEAQHAAHPNTSGWTQGPPLSFPIQRPRSAPCSQYPGPMLALTCLPGSPTGVRS